MTTPTADAVPSNLPQNLLFNAEKTDEMINSDALTFADRFGVERPTAKGIAEALRAPAVETAAYQSKLGAESARDVALGARDSALIQAGVYTTEAAGRAAVADGQAFKVQGGGDVAAYEYRRVSSTVSTLIAAYPASEAVRSARRKASGGTPTINMFDAGRVTNGGFINSLGQVEANADYSYSEPMAVVPSTAYVTSRENLAAFYTAAMAFISTQTFNIGFTTPANARFVRLSQLLSNVQAQQLEQGATRTPVVPFGSFLDSRLVARASLSFDKLDFDPVVGTASNNLFDKKQATEGMFVNGDTGAQVANADFAASDFIPVIPGQAYARKAGGNQLAFYGPDKAFVSGMTAATGTFTVPTNAQFVRLSMRVEHSDVEQLELGAVSTAYARFGAVVAADRVPFAGVVGVPSKNLFNKDAARVGYLARITDGVLEANATYSASEAIPVTPGAAYTCSRSALWVFYDSAGVRVSGVAFVTQATAPAGGVWCRISQLTADNAAQQLEAGATSTAYTPFGLKVPVASVDGLAIPTAVQFAWLLPDDIYLVSGENFSVYYNNVVKYSQALRKGNYHVAYRQVSGTAPGTLSSYDYKWSYTPAAAETFAVEFMVVDTFADTTVASKIVTFHCANAASLANRGRTANVIVMGDSFADFYGVTSYLYDFIVANGGGNSINMLGTQTTDRAGVKDEAYAGWSYNLFTTMASSGGRTNPFWNPGTSQFDFAYYMAANYPAYTPRSGAGPYIDSVASFLGINDVGGQFANPAAAVQKIVDSIHAWDPQIKVLLHTTTCPPVGDKFTTQNFALGNYEKWKFQQEKWNEMMLGFTNAAAKVWIIPTAAHFDTRNAIISAALAPDKFTPGYTEVQTTDIHPTASGAKYLADAMYQAFYNLVLR